ncbi:hypothetical protein BV898_13654 [Hypsibius exemplaris]|uniref:Uncharacterized protein n=1 Tax=Hypsibius exemplaris TaxID=2072580 RepID=A0A1W0WA72_HYPEX|nr:hypothetical protein BV898_13654 [Hypsibius exemplaris]
MEGASLMMIMATAVVLLAFAGSSAAMECSPLFSCPNLATKLYDQMTDSDSKSFCCKSGAGLPYCCDWKDYAAYVVGLDPKDLAIPVGAIIGIIVGGLVLLILFSICCCFCCGCCCFRGRKRVVTHTTVAYGKPGRDA